MPETIQTIAAVLVVTVYLQGMVASFIFMGRWAKELEEAGRPTYPFANKWDRACLSLYWPAVVIAYIGAK